jgi:hypothetical protein
MRESKLNILLEEIWENSDIMSLIASIIGVFLGYLTRFPELISYLSYLFVLLPPELIPYLPYLFVLFLSLYGLYRRADAATSEKHLPMIFVGGESLNPELSLERAKSTIKEHFGFKRFDMLEKYFHVRLWRAIYQRKLPSDPQEWMDYLEDGIERMLLVYDKVSGRKVYHLFVHRPSVIALGLGAILGRWENLPLVVYQRTGDKYEPVLNLTEEPRRIKEILDDDFRYIEVDLPEERQEKLALALEMASHVIGEDVARYVSHKMGMDRRSVIVMKNTYRGNLKEKDWTRPVQELYNLIRKLKERGVEEIHLFIAMPEAMAFGLGYALGAYWDVRVYNYSKGTYEPAFSLKELPTPSIE